MAKQDKEESSGIKIIIVNKKARFQYFILESFETGMVLTGSEIKSIREGKINIEEAYVRPHNGEMFLLGAHIAEYSHSHDTGYDPIRQRKLLMHKLEIEKLTSMLEKKGLTIVPLKVYLKNGRAKLEIGLAKGKSAPDKRQVIKAREHSREAERAMKRGK